MRARRAHGVHAVTVHASLALSHRDWQRSPFRVGVWPQSLQKRTASVTRARASVAPAGAVIRQESRFSNTKARVRA